MTIKPGSTDVSLLVLALDDDGLPVTGLTAAGFPTVSWYRAGAAAATISLSDLSGATDAHADGGVFELGDGRYRLDLPDAAVSSAGVFDVGGEDTDLHLIVVDANVGTVKLSADGLDDITIPTLTGPATTFVGMVAQVWRRFFKRSTLSSTELKTYDDDDTTVTTTQAVIEGATREHGAAS